MPTRRLESRTVAWREAGAGAPALLLHCALAHSGAFAGIMERLADGLAMRALDLPGHGGTEEDRALDPQDQAVADALALLADRGPAHLIGHSFGGTAALRLALEAPARVASLTLIEPTYFAFLAERDPAAYAAEVAAQAAFHATAGRGDWKAAGSAFLARWGAPGGLAALPPRQRDYVLPRLRHVLDSEPSIFRPETARVHPADLGRLACSLLLVEGTASPPVVAAILDVIAVALPGARRVRVAGAGHMLPVTHAAEISGALRDFLALEHA